MESLLFGAEKAHFLTCSIKACECLLVTVEMVDLSIVLMWERQFLPVVDE